jgi:hypothetical protein
MEMYLLIFRAYFAVDETYVYSDALAPTALRLSSF